MHLATDEAADGGARSNVEQNLREGRDHYPFPPGTRIGETTHNIFPPGTRIGETTHNIIGANSPYTPNSSANVEPYPVGSQPSAGPPESGDGADGVPRTVVDGVGEIVHDIGAAADSVIPG